MGHEAISVGVYNKGRAIPASAVASPPAPQVSMLTPDHAFARFQALRQKCPGTQLAVGHLRGDAGHQTQFELREPAP